MEARKNIFFAAALGLCALAATASLVSASAQQSQASTWCYATEADGVSLDLRISGCTTVIQSGKISNSDLALAYTNRGFAYGTKGQHDHAIQDYDQAIKLDPSNAIVFYNRGIAYSAKDQLDRAIQDYDQAIKLDPSDADVFYARSVARAKKGDKEGADADLAAARRTGIPAQAQKPQAWMQAATSMQARTWCYASEADGVSLDLKISGCTTVILSGTLPNSDLARAYFNRGFAYGAKGHFDHAIQDYDQAIKLNPSYANLASAYSNRGNAYRAKGQHERAIQDYDQAIKLDPSNAISYFNRGNAYSAKGQLDHAIQDYDQAIKLNPRYAFAYSNRGFAYGAKGHFDHAIQDYDQAIKLNPSDAIAYSNRGNAYNAKGQHERAIQDYDQAIKLDPSDAIAYFNRGNAYNAKGQHDHAIQDYDQAIKLNPRHASAYSNRGNAHRAKGQLDRAIQDYDQAIKLNPNLAIAHSNRGNAYSAKGQFDRAIHDFDQAIKLNPSYADAPRGQLPYIDDDSEIIGDSETIIAHLIRKYRLTIDDALAVTQRDTDHLVTRMLDDLYWVMSYSRWKDDRYWPAFRDMLLREHPSLTEESLLKAKAYNAQRYHYAGIGRYEADAAIARGLADLRVLARLIPADGFVHSDKPTSIDAGIYGFIANIYFYDIDTPLKQFVVAHDNVVRHCRAIHDAVSR